MDKERTSRRGFVLGAVKVTLVIPPVAALAFVGHQVEEGLATSFTGAGLGAAYGAVVAGIETLPTLLPSLEDTNEPSRPVTRHDFRTLIINLAKYMSAGAVGGFLSINLRRINPISYRH